jgi:hypothetical protein
MEENLLKVNNIKLVNQSHNNIRRQITNVMNAYNQIPKQINNNSKIQAISYQIRNAERIKQSISNSIKRYGSNSLSAVADTKWQNKLHKIDLQLEDLNNRLVHAKANKNKHSEARKNSKLTQIHLTRQLRLQPQLIEHNSGKENEIRYGGKHGKTHKRHHYKRHTHKHRPNKRNKTKRNCN